MILEALIALNTLASAGVLAYLLKIEHRFTRLETQMDVVMHRMRLAEE